MTPRCFYCDVALATGNRRGPQRLENDGTTDHIVPQSRLNDMGPMRNWWSQRNKVRVCARCNGLKGHLDPLDWLVIMQSSNGATRSAERLADLGLKSAEIVDAMSRRKKPCEVEGI